MSITLSHDNTLTRCCTSFVSLGNPDPDDAQPPDSPGAWYTSVLDYPACPSGHTYECECIEEERERRQASRELDQIINERFLPSQEHPP